VTTDAPSGRASRRREAEDVLIRRTARRLGLQAAAFVAVVVLLVVGAATVVLLHAEERAATELLTAAIVVADDAEDPPLDVWLVIHQPGGAVSTAALPTGADDPAALAAVAAGAPATDTVRHVRGVDYRVMTARRPDGMTVQAVLDLAGRQEGNARVLTAMLLTGAVGLLAAAAVGSWLGRRALRPLSSALALQRRFIADAGHELRTPLTLLTTRAQLLHRRLRQVRDGLPLPRAWHDPIDDGRPPHAIEDPTPGMRERAPAGATVNSTRPKRLPDTQVAKLALHDVEDIVADSTRLTAILEDLLLAADPLARRVHVPIDLTELCRGALHAASPDALDRGIILTGPAPDAPPVHVLGSTVALHRALIALIDNALRHARSTVSVSVTEDRVALVDVADDGLGIDPALTPRLFTRFANGPPAPQTGHRRYGLGLSLAAEIATAHGGRVELVDHGSTAPTTDGSRETVLRITLPLNRVTGPDASSRASLRSRQQNHS
jgi:signal transduction histidine kinase